MYNSKTHSRKYTGSVEFGIGLMGLIFPPVLLLSAYVFGNTVTIQHSLSAYYYTAAHDVFVGLMFGLAFLFFLYPSNSVVDRTLAILTGIALCGTALFPTDSSKHFFWVFNYANLHYLSAGLFFLFMICFSFTVLPKGENNRHKKLFYFCGIIKVLTLALMTSHEFVSKELAETLGIRKIFIFVMEWIFLYTFALAWFVKSHIIKKS